MNRMPLFSLCLALAALVWLGSPAEARGTDPEAAEQAAEGPAGVVNAQPATELERALLERAKGYWDARVAQTAEVYNYYPPRKAREKDTVPREFVGMGYSGYEIQRVVVDVNGERGYVVVKPVPVLSPKLEAQLRGFDYQEHLQVPYGEEWIRVDGEWFKVPQYGGLSRFHKQAREARKQRGAEEEAQAAAESADGEE